ncbi:uncharacterized protein PHACADRAFT_194753 [Phanerochaete carnosa HHB-10118-sp]|uniref:Uncharacterized protein n=1 Tax=Phanerochaete carnosa (strain HHB-10118-sp) TaxID=650164 RepID=K5WDR8_PHACS|nr:uncharacterized protein PHACADRAFT_194753 [Phanerochaete carnosa HHB-10118-sp]EKM57189.1 hypothetical protein PHACADRAFT_194753 [Phanerochaete carnosa HHB-10118-sp]
MSLVDYAVALAVVVTTSFLSLAVVIQAFAGIVHARSGWEREDIGDAVNNVQPASSEDSGLGDLRPSDPQYNDAQLDDLVRAGSSEPQPVEDLQSARRSDPYSSDLLPERSSDPHPSDPHPSDPHPSDPQPNDPQPNDPQPNDPHPGDPHPSDPHPSDPQPSNSHPISPQSGDPQPASASDHDLQLVKSSDPRPVRTIVGHSSYIDS